MSDHLSEQLREWSPGRAVAPDDQGLAPRVETTTVIGEPWTGTGQQGKPVVVPASAVSRGLTRDEAEAYDEVVESLFSERLVPAAEAHPAKRLAARLRMNAMSTNYGDLLREAADYLETVPEIDRQRAAWRQMAENPKLPVECKAAPAAEATGEMSREAFEGYVADAGSSARAKLLAHDLALRARAQRLEKAGDALVCRIDPDGYGRPALAAWAAAKEQK